ncbi:MAG: hypothetical protein HRT45_12125 [Bdellovibrionales bacterium]|nr:hypothetical protein [Bdellovibrionales bacterium]
MRPIWFSASFLVASLNLTLSNPASAKSMDPCLGNKKAAVQTQSARLPASARKSRVRPNPKKNRKSASKLWSGLKPERKPTFYSSSRFIYKRAAKAVNPFKESPSKPKGR